MADIKVAAYICKGCGLGERLDVDALVKVAQKDGKVPLAKSHDFLCNADGVAMIRNDIETEGVTHIMIGACSRRAKTEAFFFPNHAVARANLREGVIWIRPDTEEARETTQDMAEDYIRMGCAEVKAMTAPGGNTNTGSSKTLLVVGGGVTGMTTALEASKTGYSVVLVEKSGELGGWAGKLYKRTPVHEPFKSPADTGVADLASQVMGDSNIKVYLNATIAKTDGAPGRFVVDIATESGATHTEDIGAIVQATGFTLYDMNKLPELGGGKSPNVVDQAGLEVLAKAAAAGDGVIRRPSDNQPVKSVVFVQCAGQRDASGTHLSYCSGFCCNASIKQAMYFKDANPSVDTTIIYTDLRTPGNGEDFYRSAQEKGVIFTKGKVAEVVPGGNTSTVKFHDLILDDKDAAMADVDLVVLATGQVANSGINIDALTKPQVEGQEGEPSAESAAVEVKPISILNLTYRQGPDVPQLKQGFTDSHFICFPYETRRTGIYTAGPVRRPMDIAQAREDATGAALKAIQALENAELGRAAHPDPGVRERRLPGARHGGHEPQRVFGFRTHHPDPLPRLGQHHLGNRRAERRLRRRDDDGLQVRRAVPVPLREGLRTRPCAHVQDRRHAEDAEPRVGARARPGSGHHRHQARARDDQQVRRGAGRHWPQPVQRLLTGELHERQHRDGHQVPQQLPQGG